MFAPPSSSSLSARALPPSCFKTTTVFIPKKNPSSSLNDYRPVTLTPITRKCFKRMMLAHIQKTIPETLDPLRYAYRPNMLNSDAIAAINYCFSHLENKDSCIRMLFVDYSSTFNTAPPKKTHP